MATRVPVDRDAAVEVRTTGMGEPLVLIQTALAPDELVPLSREPGIADHFRVIDCRRRGYSSSTPVHGPGSMTRDAQDCLAVMKTLAGGPAHVLGVSYSGAVALEVAATAPRSVRTLTLIEPPPRHGPPAAEFTAANEKLLAIFQRDGVTAALEHFTHVLGTPSWLAERSGADPEFVARIERDAATFFTADIPALLTWQFDSERASAVTCPVLYIGGAESHPWFGHVHRWITTLFPGCEDHLVTGAGHSAVSTHTTRVATLLTAFLAKSDP
jgi:pimeloyl-ACP methyl ester carboxylesterase